MTAELHHTNHGDPANTPLALKSNEGLGAWLPIASAPASGLILLSVEDAAGECRTFAAEASYDDNGALIWQITTGWTGWTRLHAGWRAVSWRRLPQAPNVRAKAPT
jgi:hypothetical protein